jgi:porphobilinogen deaminase
MRRKAQLLHAHPHLNVVPVRGSIDARLAMLESGELDAIVLAAAGGRRCCRRVTTVGARAHVLWAASGCGCCFIRVAAPVR